MRGAQLGDYLSQFYSEGPYVHNADNPLPYQAAFFSSQVETNNNHIRELNEIIRKMEANERIFYNDMGVSGIKQFNEEYMMGKSVLNKGRIARASSFKGTFWSKINFLITVQLKKILTIELTAKDYTNVIETAFGKGTANDNSDIWERAKVALIKAYSRELMSKKSIDKAALILINHLYKLEKTSALSSVGIELTPQELSQISGGLIRARKLLGEKNDFSRVAPSVEEAAKNIHFKNMRAAIDLRVKRATGVVKKELRTIFEQEYTAKGKKLPEKKLLFFQKTLIDQINEWANDSHKVNIFKTDSALSSEIGEQGLRILYKLKFGRKITGLRQTGGIYGEQVIKSYNIKTGEVTAKLKKKKTEDEEDEEFKHVGNITPDIIFKAKKSKRIYAFSVKNYLGSMLLDGLEELSIHIRGKKKLSTFLGEASASTGSFSGVNISHDEIQRFVYVFINNLFRDEDNSMLLIKFMSSLINFYLQNEFIDAISHVSKEVGDVRNSFIVLAGMYLIPMSSVLRSVRDT